MSPARSESATFLFSDAKGLRRGWWLFVLLSFVLSFAAAPFAIAAPPMPVASSTSPVDLSQPDVAFDAANKLYEQGKHAAAARAYQQLVDAGQGSATLYFNLGNAWFKAGQNGRAIAAYRRAERLTPRDPNIRFNLQFARKRALGGEPPAAPLTQRLVSTFTLNEWTVLAALAVSLTFLILAAGEARATFRPTARRYAALTGVASGLLIAVATAAYAQWNHPDGAVTITPEAIVRSGPLEDAREMFTFRDGTEVTILDEKQWTSDKSAQPWYQIRNAAGNIGWLRADQLQLIR